MNNFLPTLPLAIIGGLVPVIIWLWFWLKEDKNHPEPKRLIFKTFLVGGLSVLVAFWLETSLCSWSQFDLACSRVRSDLVFLIGGPEKFLLFLWAGAEELVKFGAAYWAAFRTRFFDEPVDAMIYLITAALGFAAVENAFFLYHLIQGNAVVGGNALVLLTGNMRFLGANIVHVISSALVGGMAGLAFTMNWFNKIGYILFGLVTATILHATFNFLIITSNGGKIFTIFFLLWLLAILIILMFERVKAVAH